MMIFFHNTAVPTEGPLLIYLQCNSKLEASQSSVIAYLSSAAQGNSFPIDSDLHFLDPLLSDQF